MSKSPGEGAVAPTRSRAAGKSRRGLGLLAAGVWLLLFPCAQAHPFDGDGNGPAKEGANAQAYVYLEPSTCRVECLLWLPAALRRLGLPGGEALLLPPADKRGIVSKAGAAAPGWLVLKIDGKEAPVTFLGATVLKGAPGRSENLTEDGEIPVMEGMLGLSWEGLVPARYEKLEMEWRGFDETVVRVPVTITYGPMAERGMVLTAAQPGGVWMSEGRLPKERPLAEVPVPEPPAVWHLPVAALVWGGVGLVVCVVLLRQGVPGGEGRSGIGIGMKMRRVLVAGVVTVAGCALLGSVFTVEVPRPGAAPRLVQAPEAEGILLALIRNTYRSFDQSEESAIYDVLSRSIEGPLLEQLYLQTLQALKLEGQDGTRVKVTDLSVQVESVSALPAQPEGFSARCRWNALGTVGHWGHLHQRINRYTADVKVEAVGGAWKMTGLEVLEESRL